MKYGLKKQNKKIMQQYVINFNHVLDSLVQLWLDDYELLNAKTCNFPIVSMKIWNKATIIFLNKIKRMKSIFVKDNVTLF